MSASAIGSLACACCPRSLRSKVMCRFGVTASRAAFWRSCASTSSGMNRGLRCFVCFAVLMSFSTVRPLFKLPSHWSLSAAAGNILPDQLKRCVFRVLYKRQDNGSNQSHCSLPVGSLSRCESGISMIELWQIFLKFDFPPNYDSRGQQDVWTL